MSKQTNDWMQKLVENYRIPSEEEQSKNSEQPKMLKESQIKKILERDQDISNIIRIFTYNN